ncbi:MAG: SbmA/BacA-like family transporter [Verrucomicrobiota bacterium]
MSVKQKLNLIRTTGARLKGVASELFKSREGPRALRLALFIVALILAVNVLNVLNSFVGRDFMSAIEKKDALQFWSQAGLYAMVFAISSVVAALYRFTEERLGILWREQLTWRLTERYLNNRTYHRLDSSDIANPDQRITDDVNAFTTTTLAFTLLILNGTITAISFTGVLWSISPMLFGVAAVYAVLGSVMTILLGKPLIRLNYHQFDHEANFRRDLIHIRENSESIALSHREGRFRNRLDLRLRALASNFRKLIRVNRNVAFFTNNYNYFIQIIPALLIAPKFIRGEVEFGVITQSTMAFATLLGAFSLIVTQIQSISAFTAVTARLHLLTDAIEQANQQVPSEITIESVHERVEYRNVTLLSNDGKRELVKNLSFAIHPGSRWLVTAPDDAPKVAFFRATAGVWHNGAGRMLRPGLKEIFFLPERPYMPPGPLRNVLVISDKEDDISDATVEKVLADLDLTAVLARIGGLSADRNWDDELSIGEQHLFSLARLILAKPRFVFLDRPGSSLPKAQIASLLDLLRVNHISCVVLAKNGESNLPYDRHLEIHADATWSITRNDELPLQDRFDDLAC